jgi:hypothetical protein
MAVVLSVVGTFIALIGGIWIAVLAFQESVLWGLGCLFIPFVSLIFVILHWDTAWKPFLIALAGVALTMLGSLLGAGSSSG